MIMQLPTKLCIAAATGILSHHLIFIRNEHHILAPQIFRFFLFLSFVLVIGEAKIWELSDSAQAVKASALILISYSASLFASIVIYRILFHPLRKFPGPLGARVSKFWHVGKLLGQPNFKVLHELHQQYGGFVRTGVHHTIVVNSKKCEIVDRRCLQDPMRFQSAVPPQWLRSMAPAASALRHPSTTSSSLEPPSLPPATRSFTTSAAGFGIKASAPRLSTNTNRK